MKPIILFLTLALFGSPLSARQTSGSSPLLLELLQDRRLVGGVAGSAAIFLIGNYLKDKAGPDRGTLSRPPAIDRRFRDWFFKPGKQSNWLDEYGVYYTLAAGLGASMLIPGGKADTEARLRSLIAFTSGFALNGGLTWGIKGLVSRPRPYVYYGTTGSPEKTKAWRSFISGHASAAFYTASFLHLAWQKNHTGSPRQRVILPVLLYSSATYVAWSRLEIDRHYFTDLIAGAAVGVAVGYLTHWWFEKPRAAAAAAGERSMRMALAPTRATLILNF